VFISNTFNRRIRPSWYWPKDEDASLQAAINKGIKNKESRKSERFEIKPNLQAVEEITPGAKIVLFALST
jgi:hypothetical protein